MRDVLCWLPVSQSIKFIISACGCRCQLGRTPAYLQSFVALPQIWLAAEVFILHLDVNL